MDVAPEGAGQRGRGRVVEVARPEAAVPEVGGGVLVRDEEDGEGGGGGGEDGVGGGRVVFVGVGGEGFGEGGPAQGGGGLLVFGVDVIHVAWAWTYMRSVWSDSRGCDCTSDAFYPLGQLPPLPGLFL